MTIIKEKNKVSEVGLQASVSALIFLEKIV